MPNVENKSRFQVHTLVIAAYLVLAIVLTWPTAGQMNHFLPGDGGDDPAIAWNLWWVKYSLLNEPGNPFDTNFMFYPLGVNLAYYTLTTLNGLASIPLLLNLGVVAASNLHMWFSLAVTAYGTFLLSLWQSQRLLPASKFSRAGYWGAVLAGLMVGFASHKTFYLALGQFNIASTHWMPFAMLFFLKMYLSPATKQNRWAMLTALFLVFQTWTEMTYASFLLIFMALFWLLWLIANRFQPLRRWAYLKNTLLLGGLFIVGISPILAAMLPDMLLNGDFLVEGGGFADIFSADLFGFMLPTVLHPWWGEWVTQTNVMRLDSLNPQIQHIYKGQHIYLGLTLTILAAIGAYVNRKQWEIWFWVAASLLFINLALGPEVIVNGRLTGVPGTFVIMQQLPFFKGNRYPSRYSVMIFLSLAPLVALGGSWLLARIRAAKWQPQGVAMAAMALGAIFIAEHLSTPLPQSDMRVPQIYEQIAADPRDITVLDIPFAWRNGFRITGAFTTGFMFGQFYQTVHQKPMLQGNTSRNPELLFQYFTQAPVLNTLRLLETGHDIPPESWATDSPYIDAVLQTFNIGYIVVRSETPGYLNNPQATIPYLEAMFPLEILHQTDTLTLYRVNQPPWPMSVQVLADPVLTPLYLADGWGVPTDEGMVAAQRRRNRLLVPLNGETQTVRLQAKAPVQATTTIRLRVNDWVSAPQPLGTEWQDYHFTVPMSNVETGLNEIFIEISDLTQPNYPDITVVSAGEEAGNLGHIYLNGVDVSPNERGYNVAIISTAGQLLENRAFDTHADSAAGESLAVWLNSLPDDVIVAAAAKDEASAQLTESAVNALKRRGSNVDLRGSFRGAHAFVGGAQNPPIEAADAYQPVKITTNLGATEPQIGALFREISFLAEK